MTGKIKTVSRIPTTVKKRSTWEIEMIPLA